MSLYTGMSTGDHERGIYRVQLIEPKITCADVKKCSWWTSKGSGALVIMVFAVVTFSIVMVTRLEIATINNDVTRVKTDMTKIQLGVAQVKNDTGTVLPEMQHIVRISKQLNQSLRIQIAHGNRLRKELQRMTNMSRNSLSPINNMTMNVLPNLQCSGESTVAVLLIAESTSGYYCEILVYNGQAVIYRTKVDNYGAYASFFITTQVANASITLRFVNPAYCVDYGVQYFGDNITACRVKKVH